MHLNVRTSIAQVGPSRQATCRVPTKKWLSLHSWLFVTAMHSQCTLVWRTGKSSFLMFHCYLWYAGSRFHKGYFKLEAKILTSATFEPPSKFSSNHRTPPSWKIYRHTLDEQYSIWIYHQGNLLEICWQYMWSRLQYTNLQMFSWRQTLASLQTANIGTGLLYRETQLAVLKGIAWTFSGLTSDFIRIPSIVRGKNNGRGVTIIGSNNCSKCSSLCHIGRSYSASDRIMEVPAVRENRLSFLKASLFTFFKRRDNKASTLQMKAIVFTASSG